MLEHTEVSRRLFLGGFVAIVSGVSGCLSFGGGRVREGGDVVVNNESGDHRTVEVTTSKIHEDDRQPDGDPDDLTPPTSHLLQRNETFQIPVGGTRSSSELITEPGTYHIYARDDQGGEDAVEYGFYPAGRDGESPGGGVVLVNVGDSDRTSWVDISVAHFD